MTRAEYDTKSAVLLTEFAKHFDPQRGPSNACVAASMAISQHATDFKPEWYPKSNPTDPA